MAGRKENDEISKLLDSFEADGALEEKMEGFAAKKRRQDKYTQQVNMIDPEDPQETEIPSTNDTVVLRPPRPQQPEPEAGETVMFDPDQIEEQEEPTNKTVVINDDEIQSLLEQEQAPKLRREVKGHPKKPTATMRKKNDKTVKIVLAVLVSLLVVAVIGTGAYVLLNGIGEKTEEVENDRQKVAYERIKDWLDTVDDDFTGIEDMENYYNRLSDKQKAEIDDLLKSRSGYTFDELLARAKSDEKKDSSNNNTEIAELRAKLSTLQTQLSSAQSTLDSAKSTLTTRQSEYDTLVGQSQNAANAQANLESAQAAVDACEARRQELLQKQTEGTITDEELVELNDIYGEWSSLNDALEQAQREVNNSPAVSQSQLDSAAKAVSQAQSAVDQAQSAVDEINSQIAHIQSQIDGLE